MIKLSVQDKELERGNLRLPDHYQVLTSTGYIYFAVAVEPLAARALVVETD